MKQKVEKSVVVSFVKGFAHKREIFKIEGEEVRFPKIRRARSFVRKHFPGERVKYSWTRKPANTVN